ncbi:MAG: ribosomal protein S18-alanine N-acetyltransferase [Chloroflexota bacterium]
MSCYVRQMCKEDVDQITEIDREAFPTQWPPPNYQSELKNHMAHLTVVCDGDKPVEQQTANTPPEKSSPGLAARLRRLFSRNSSLGNEASPSTRHYIVGFVASWIMADEAHITSIAVREAYRRQGLGEQLIISAIEMAMEQKASILTLEVRVSNTGAQALYSKYGFTQVGLRKAYYTDNREDAIIMSTDKITTAPFQARFQQLKAAYARRKAMTDKTSPPN